MSIMNISRDKWHKRRATGGCIALLMKKRKIHTVRTMGGNKKYRTRIIDVVYNLSNNEFVRTKTLVKSFIIQIDSTLFRQWNEAHYTQTKYDKKKEVEVEQALEKQVDGYILEGNELEFSSRKLKSKKTK
ncbi:unnamed protein product [Candidula unifasciata]|uniref:Uncharacterized protein n=1 Tax=Candidula unifasciata TaxID=100452 RepID=A0A8S3ZHC1_9EUPU|nr:unnamed protein product [Candidula unifasciata]